MKIIRNFKWATLAFLMGTVSHSLFAQDIEDPAGDVDDGYEEYSYEEYAPDNDNGNTEDMDQPVEDEAGTDGNATPTEEGEAGGEETWDSYSDMKATGSVAEEITEGVRVEDIVEPPSDYRYAAFGKPDPFVPPLLSRDNSVDSLEIPIVSPLQQFALDKLGLVGVWQMADGTRKGMVLTSGDAMGSQGIIVKNGDPIGNKGGKIIGIGEDYITVREFTLGPDGTREYEDHQMFMGDRAMDSVTGTITFNPGEKNTIVKLDEPDDVGLNLNDMAIGDGAPANGTPENAAEMDKFRKDFDERMKAIEAESANKKAATPAPDAAATPADAAATGAAPAPGGEVTPVPVGEPK